jgi:PEP-CTERM motif
VGKSIGYCLTKTGQDAMLWSTTGTATVLQDVGGEGFSDVVAINSSAHSVGYSSTASGDEAMLWSPSGKATNLSAILGPAWSDTEAVGINLAGDIVGYGFFEGGQHGFLLTPVSATAFSATLFSTTSVPEPSTWAMFMVGFTGLALVGRRFRKLGSAP